MENADAAKYNRTRYLAQAGRKSEALQELDDILRFGAHKPSSLGFAHIYALIGDRDAAFAYLQKSFDERDSDLISLKVDSDFDALRDDARYQNILRRIGLAE